MKRLIDTIRSRILMLRHAAAAFALLRRMEDEFAIPAIEGQFASPIRRDVIRDAQRLLYRCGAGAIGDDEWRLDRWGRPLPKRYAGHVPPRPMPSADLPTAAAAFLWGDPSIKAPDLPTMCAVEDPPNRLASLEETTRTINAMVARDMADALRRDHPSMVTGVGEPRDIVLIDAQGAERRGRSPNGPGTTIVVPRWIPRGPEFGTITFRQTSERTADGVEIWRETECTSGPPAEPVKAAPASR